MKLHLHQFDLPLRHTFTIARGSTSVYRTLVVELEEDGHRGFGEAGENDYFGATLPGMAEAMESVRGEIESREAGDPARLWQELDSRLCENRFAQCALDMAAWDLWGKLCNEPVWKLWGLSLDGVVPSDYTIGIDTVDVMIAKLREFPGWPVYKIKLGTPDDLQIIRRLRAATDAVFRVDANCGWTVGETIANATAFAELGVELIEQPLVPEDREGMRQARAQCPLPLVADESCQQEPDVDRCDGLFDGVNVKLVKCGGLTPARRMLARARELGMQTMIGCMTESTVGISAVAQLLPLVDYADMDGAVLLAEDCATGVSLDHGRVVFPTEPGTGVRLK